MFDADEDLAGFCYSAKLEQIETNGFVLTPGRYVGAAGQEDDDEPFDQKMQRLTTLLKQQQEEGGQAGCGNCPHSGVVGIYPQRRCTRLIGHANESCRDSRVAAPGWLGGSGSKGKPPPFQAPKQARPGHRCRQTE